MASGDNVDVIEVVETSFGGPARNLAAPSRNDDSGDEDDKSTGEKVTAFDTSTAQHGSGGPKTPVGVSRNKSERERKLGHRRVGVGGEITYKKIQTTQIMGSIQLGIQHAVGGLASKPERDLLMQDFMTVETTNFPSEGSNHTPAHHFSEFKFKNYAPIAFRYFRDLFGIQPDDFLMSMCSSPLRELSNPGASGSIFYLTNDDEFIIKTVQHKEGEFLQTLLPGYYMNLNQNPRTLLPKFFGLYCYRCNSKNVRLVAMNNLLPSAVKLHEKYDLKGSTYKRKASKAERSKSSPTFKDLDFMEFHPEGIFLEADVYVRMVRTMQTDCRVLESFKIMDYSLLVGIHNLDQAAREKSEQRLSASAEEEPGEPGYESSGFVHAEREREQDDRVGAVALNRSRSINRQRLVAHSTAMESIQAESEPIDVEGDVRDRGGIPARNARGERLLLFLGIIDILQSYRLKKKLEHTWKSMIHDGDTVSVHRPGFYAQRFQDFMTKTVFKKIPSLDLPEIKGNHRKFRNLVTSYIALKHSPSKRKSISRPLRPLEGDFDSTAVAASGGAAMHATSPTKLASPTGIETVVSSSGNVVTNSGSSVPIATSTPVNLPTTGAGGAVVSVAPPPLSAGGAGGGIAAVDGATRTSSSYPAVLKGRSSGASPPNPNLVPSGKVPPPVPPRGSGASGRSSRGGNEEQRGNASSSSSTSGRGTTTTTNAPGSGVAGKATFGGFLPIPWQHQPQTTYRDRRYREQEEEDEFVSVERYEDSYIIRTSPSPFRPERGRYRFARSSDGGTEGPDRLRLAAGDRAGLAVPNQGGLVVSDQRKSAVPDQGGLAVSDQRKSAVPDGTRLTVPDQTGLTVPNQTGLTVPNQTGLAVPNQTVSPVSSLSLGHSPGTRPNERSTAERYAESMSKFTYFINPGGTTYKMSRKDKKHSETYAERVRRQQEEALRSSGGRMRIGVVHNNPDIFVQPASLITPVITAKNYREEKRREFENSTTIPTEERKKSALPRPSFRKPQIFAAAPKSSRAYLFRSEKRMSTVRRANADYLRHADRDLVVSHLRDSEIVERREISVESYGDRSVRQAASESSLFAPRDSTTTRSLATREFRYSARRRTSMKFSTPNIRMENTRQPETLKTYLSDHEYKDYLNETSSREELSLAPSNTSFLHGYASTRSYK